MYSVGQKQPADIIPVAEGKFECTYYPEEEGKCKVEVTYANQQVPNRYEPLPFSLPSTKMKNRI